jgi:tetratricopeptide (TPR) repeat protein
MDGFKKILSSRASSSRSGSRGVKKTSSEDSNIDSHLQHILSITLEEESPQKLKPANRHKQRPKVPMFLRTHISEEEYELQQPVRMTPVSSYAPPPVLLPSSNESSPDRASILSDSLSVSTHIADNVTTDTTSLGLSSLVCLSVLETLPKAAFGTDQWGELLTPRPERIVRECLDRNMSYYLLPRPENTEQQQSRQEHSRARQNNNNNTPAEPLPASTIGWAHFRARECLQQSNTSGAIHTYKALLQKQPQQVDAQRADTLSKLSVLCLVAGRNQEAAKYSTEALSLHRDNYRPLHAAVGAMEVGLVQFGSNKLSRALKMWREALQMACMAMGYDHPHVAVLLNNIGVLHFESGDLIGCLTALEESVELQRMLLRSTLLNVEHSLHQLATTMGNLAMAYERRGQCDQSVSLLQESLSLYESMNNPKIQDTMQIVSLNIERLVNNSSSSDNSDMDPKSPPELEGVESRAKVDHTAPGMYRAQSRRTAVTPDNNVGPPNPRTKAHRSAEMFGNSDRLLKPRGKAHSMAEDSDNHDFLLLGSLSPLLTPKEQVRETVLAWFSTDRSFVSLASIASVKRKTTPSPVSPEDELHLAEIHLQAVEHLERDEITDALDLLRSALLDQRQRYGNIHRLVGNSLHSIGMVHLFAKQYIQAHACFVDAIHVRSETLGPDHPDVAASKMKIGLIELAAGELEEARKTFRDIREMFLGALGYGHPQFAKITNNLGVVLYHSGEFSGAMSSFELAYEYHRQRHQDGLGGSELADLGIANSLCNIGFIFAKTHCPVDALGCYERALQFLRKHLKDDDESVLELQRNINFLVATGGFLMWDDGQNSCNPGDASCMTDWFGAAFAR